MNKRQAKRRRDIKTKLMAAICMLMVSSIMMVSTTYAWFTLSTAPEVTGISTSVGANGNLEMALVPESGNLDEITSAAGDSTKSLDVKNNTWGNLVDLSYTTDGVPNGPNYYGMDKIVLYPAALNIPDGMEDAAGNPTQLNSISPLKIPEYSADGRVGKLLENTVTSTYDSTESNFPQNKLFGVRAVGTASGMTDRQLAYRNAQSAANTAMSLAKTNASQSLNNNGSALANIAIKKATGGDSATYTQADVASLKAIVTDLLGNGTDKTGVLEYIENAYKNYIIAIAASKASQSVLDDTAFKAFQSDAAGKTLYELETYLTEKGVTLETTIAGYIDAIASTRADVEAAKSELESLTGDSITWTDINKALQKLATIDAMQVNGFTPDEIKANMSALVNSVTAQGGLVVKMATGGGVYADIADHSGNYTASITIDKVEYNGLVLNDMAARMETASTVATAYLDATNTAVGALGAPINGEGGQVMPVTDMFGYILDLAFRTNAADSDLLLQVAGVDRIYSTNKDQNADTWGGGSNMTFTSVTTDFTLKQMAELMKAIRIVYFDPDTQAVYATARLDMDDEWKVEVDKKTGTSKDVLVKSDYTSVGGNQITANIELYVKTAAGITYEPATQSQFNEQNGIFKLDGGEYQPVEDFNGETWIEGIYFVKVETTAGTQTIADNVLMPLTQNTPTKLSVLVYLDGNLVGNDDVAASAAKSMTGTMNLQFASSANLVPMDYTELKNQGQAAASPDEVKVTVPEGVTGNTTATKGNTYTFTYTGTDTVSVTVGGVAATATSNGSGEYTIAGEAVTGDIVITLTPAAG